MPKEPVLKKINFSAQVKRLVPVSLSLIFEKSKKVREKNKA
jgi:hypothetical protein